jgi:hypothetical protein
MDKCIRHRQVGYLIDAIGLRSGPGHKGHPHLRNVIKVKKNDKVHFKTQNVNYLGPKERSVLQDQFPDELVDPEAMNKIYKQTKFDHLDANTTVGQGQSPYLTQFFFSWNNATLKHT